MAVDVAIVVGTRPEVIKLAPVVFALREAGLAVHILASGQHRELLAGALADFDLAADTDLAVMEPDQQLPALTAKLVEGLSAALARISPRAVLVQGDTTTTMVGALSAFYLSIPCGHVEAGLRSGDISQPWPEEMNRRVTSQLATRHYAPTETAKAALVAEGISEDSIVISGQTAVDAALWMAAKLSDEPPDDLRGRVPAEGRLVYATMHRRENIGGGIREVANALVQAVESYEDVTVLLAAHPNPKVRAELEQAVKHPRLVVTGPVGYRASVWLMKNAAAIVSDSGGLQEEAPSFGTPVLITREVTERPEAVVAGFNRLVGTDPARIAEELARVLADGSLKSTLRAQPNPFGDGRSAARIAGDIATGRLA